MGDVNNPLLDGHVNDDDIVTAPLPTGGMVLQGRRNRNVPVAKQATRRS
jgi:hypothetical protein